MGVILTGTSDYDAIRVRLGVTTDDLPDSDITTIGLLQVAEAMITAVVTDYATIMAGGATNNKTFLQAAALALCGSLATRKLELQRGQSFKEGDYSESATKVNWDALRQELATECRAYLLLISTHVPATRPTLLVASGPTSSGSNWPTVVDRWFARIRPHLITWLSDSGIRLYSWENMP